MSKKKKPYFHNNVEAIRQAPDKYFGTIAYDELMDWKIGGYELPITCCCIIRERSLVTGKVKEYVYQRPKAAKKKLTERMEAGEYEFTVCNDEAIHLLTPGLIDEEDYDDPIA